MAEDARWLERFHGGDRAVLEECYREHFQTVERSVGAVLSGADRDTVVHEVFFRLLTRREVRAGFAGGSMPAWLGVVARNLALDHVRRYRREEVVAPGVAAALAERAADPPLEDDLDARRLIGRFRSDVLPARWRPVFEARFVAQLSQREAAARLRMHRTTLAYQEARIRRLLRRFLLRGDPP